jgi:hypothetical protein
MRKYIAAMSLLLLIGLPGTTAMAGGGSVITKSDSRYPDYEIFSKVVFADWQQFGTCAMIKMDDDPGDESAEPFYRGQCELKGLENFCVNEAGKKRCFSGDALGMVTGLKFKKKGTKAKLKWQIFFFEGQEEPTVTVLYYYKFKNKDDVWLLSRKAQSIVFDMPRKKE